METCANRCTPGTGQRRQRGRMEANREAHWVPVQKQLLLKKEEDGKVTAEGQATMPSAVVEQAREVRCAVGRPAIAE